VPAEPNRATRPPALVVVSVVAWLASAIAFSAAPLSGGIGATALVFLLLFAVPGLLLIAALGVDAGDSPWSWLALSVAVGSGVILPLAALTHALGQPLERGALALLGLELVPLVAVLHRWRRGGVLPPLWRRDRSAALWASDAIAGAGALLLGWVFVRWISIDIRAGDLWYYLSYSSWMFHQPGLEYVPHSLDPEELNPRLIASGFLAAQTVIARLLRVDGTPLDVLWYWLPATLAPLALVSLYALGCTLCRSARARAALVVVQLLLVFTTLAYLTDRDSSGVRWPGTVLFFRIAQDKVFLAYLLTPAIAIAAIRYLRALSSGGPSRSWLTLFATIGLAAVITHPLGLPFAAIAALPYAALRALARRDALSARGLLLLALALVPLAACPLSQRADEGAPNTLADVAGFERRAHLTRDSLAIESRAENRYTAHPSLVSHPLLGVGIASGLALGGLAVARRRSLVGGDDVAAADAGEAPLFVFALTATIVSMLYLPALAPLAGRIVTPYLLWRFTWLLPVALAIAVLFDAVAGGLAKSRVGRAAPWIVGVAALAGVVAIGAPRDLVSTRSVLEQTLPFVFDSPTSRSIAEGIQERVGGERVLLDPLLQELALAYAPHLKTVYWRSGSDPRLYKRVSDFYNARFVGGRHLELLREYGFGWVAVRRGLPILADATRRPELFERVAEIETTTLFRVRDLEAAFQSPDPVEYWRRRVAESTESSESSESQPQASAADDRAQFASALAAAGRAEEASAEFERALRLDASNATAHAQLGTLALSDGKYERAERHLRRAVELAPKDRFAANNLAWLLATCPDAAIRSPGEAVALAENFARGEGADATSLDTLAASYAAAGRFEDAARSLRRAIDLVEGSGSRSPWAQRLRERLAGYEGARAHLAPPAR
jgi:tetratricopeptide (TPR) repeat protein